MAKASGGTRGGSTKAHNAKSGGVYKAIKKLTFSKVFNGQWEMDSPYGGAQILESDSLNGHFLGNGEKVYEVNLWDGKYNVAPKKSFSTLNAAKQYVKKELKRINS